MLFQAAGFIILAAFYVCYFIKMINQKKKGIQTNQMGKGKTGFAKGIEVTMKTASFLVPMAEIGSIVFNISFFPNTVRIIGVCVGAIGVLICHTYVSFTDSKCGRGVFAEGFWR